MFNVFERFNARIASLLDSKEHVAQLVLCQEAEAAIVLRAVQSLDESRDADLFWLYPEPFESAAAYAAAIESNLATFTEAVRSGQRAQHMPVWPALPRPTGAAPVERLRQLIAFTRDLVPVRGVSLSVWGLMPTAIADHAAWAALLAGLVEHEWPFPWCHGTRMYLRASDEATLRQVIGRPRLDVHKVDLSPPVIEKGLHEDASSDKLDLGRRIQSALVLAGIDQSHKRFPQAMEKYQLVLKYALNVRQPAIAGIAALGIGDVLKATGRPGDAEHWYIQAIQAAGAGPAPAVPVAHNALRSCTGLAEARSDWAAVEAYSGSAAPLAGMLCMPDQRIECMEKQAEAQLRQGKAPEAIKTWTTAADAARAGELHDAERRILKRLIEQADKSGDAAAVAKWRDRLSSVARPVAAGAPHAKGPAT